MANQVNDFQLTRNFNLQEFESPGNQEVKISNALVQRLQVMRDKIKHPIIVTSGYRTPEHNKKIKGAPQSKHLQGIAVDISTLNHSIKRLVDNAIKVGFSGIITYPDRSCIHLDLRQIPLLVIPKYFMNWVTRLVGLQGYHIYTQKVFFKHFTKGENVRRQKTKKITRPGKINKGKYKKRKRIS